MKVLALHETSWLNMAAAPTSIQVLVIPADGSEYRYEPLEAAQMEWCSEAEEDLHHDSKNTTHLVLHYHKHASQPNVSLLPDARKYTWDDEAWKKCSVVATPKLHMFFTYLTRENTPNPHFRSAVSGDVFVLKLSDTKDEHGQKFYVILEPEDWTEKEVQRLIHRISLNPNYYIDEADGAGCSTG